MNGTYIVRMVNGGKSVDLADFKGSDDPIGCAYSESLGFIRGVAMGMFSDFGKKKVEISRYLTDKTKRIATYIVLVDGMDQWNFSFQLCFVPTLDEAPVSC